MKRKSGWFFPIAAMGGLFHLGSSWIASRRLSDRLISPEGLGPTENRRDRLLATLQANARRVEEYRHRGSPLDPIELCTVFASPDDAERRPTILFLHGKGGNASEWEPDARRALRLGYNVLLPDLRAHGASGGSFVTYGLLEKDDLANGLARAQERFGLDPERIGLHSCSAGTAVALAFAAGRPGIRAIWLESPFASLRQMARHYLSIVSGVPGFFLGLTTRLAVARAEKRVRRELGLKKGDTGWFDPVRVLARVTAPVLLVYGEEDRLVPPRFARRLAAALPPGSEVWRAAGAGHCHHENEAEKVAAEEYSRRWSDFFQRHLPVDSKSTVES